MARLNYLVLLVVAEVTMTTHTSTHRTPRWMLAGCMTVAVMVVVLLCWFATLGYMTTLRMAGL